MGGTRPYAGSGAFSPIGGGRSPIDHGRSSVLRGASRFGPSPDPLDYEALMSAGADLREVSALLRLGLMD